MKTCINHHWRSWEVHKIVLLGRERLMKRMAHVGLGPNDMRASHILSIQSFNDYTLTTLCKRDYIDNVSQVVSNHGRLQHSENLKIVYSTESVEKIILNLNASSLMCAQCMWRRTQFLLLLS